MNIKSLGIWSSLLLALVAFSSCGVEENKSKVVINEILMTNETNFQDDYGVHSAWLELFNKSYSTVNVAANLLRCSDTPGDTATYFIPKGDVLTQMPPRQHLLFWADGKPNRGTFHVNFSFNADKDTWIGLYDSGKRLLDEVRIPAGTLKTDESYARIIDGGNDWEIKGESDDKYVTPSTNNKTLDKNEKMEKFEKHDKSGIGMSITAMMVVFVGLILLYLVFKLINFAGTYHAHSKAGKTKGLSPEEVRAEMRKGDTPGEVFAAIALAMHEMQEDVHDVEETVLTIQQVQRRYSPWNSKIYTLRETPHK